MKVHTNILEFTGAQRPVVTIGTFDGVHKGHQKILRKLNELAQKENGESVLFTFHPHPRMVLYPDDHGLQLLNTQPEKTLLLEKAGIDHLVVVPFSKEFSRMSAEEFIIDILWKGLGAHSVVIGYDHRFGKDREGDINTLRTLAKRSGFTVHEIPAQEVDHIKVSSTKIREALLSGKVASARELLGYYYPLHGKVVHGEGKGKGLGFPTANLVVDDQNKLIPANGVYAVRVIHSSTHYSGMMNIGVRPTLHDGLGPRTIEVHILDFDQDLYEENLEVRFVDRIRDERKFNDASELKAQLVKDRERVTQCLQRMKA